MSADGRSAILERIRSASGQYAAAETRSPEAEWDLIARNYEVAGTLSPQSKLELLEDRLRGYDAEVTRVAHADLPSAIEKALRQRNEPTMLVPQGLPTEWLPQTGSFTEDQGFAPRELDTFDGVLTSATLAIAETGTLVLQDVPGQGRRAATLVPDFHLCVVRVEDIVQNVPEAFARLRGTATLPTTFVSGPSATADIEMTRIKGVHGPRFLHVLIVINGPDHQQFDNDSTAAESEEQWR